MSRVVNWLPWFGTLVVAFAVANPEDGVAPAHEALPDARELIRGALEQVRGRSSYAELAMIVHRPTWERHSELRAWTRGQHDALIRFTAPPREAGNATLKLGEKMWTYTPKLNRVIRLPFSMMSQSWAGSDFSYNDLSRSDKLLNHYDHRVAATSEHDGHVVYEIESVPHETAPVVWGKEVMRLRDDYVLLEQTFYDQDMQPLKRMVTLAIEPLADRPFATRLRMRRLDEEDRWTEVHYGDVEFGIELPDQLFTQFSLRNAP